MMSSSTFSDEFKRDALADTLGRSIRFSMTAENLNEHVRARAHLKSWPKGRSECPPEAASECFVRQETASRLRFAGLEVLSFPLASTGFVETTSQSSRIARYTRPTNH